MSGNFLHISVPSDFRESLENVSSPLIRKKEILETAGGFSKMFFFFQMLNRDRNFVNKPNILMRNKKMLFEDFSYKIQSFNCLFH